MLTDLLTVCVALEVTFLMQNYSALEGESLQVCVDVVNASLTTIPLMVAVNATLGTAMSEFKRVQITVHAF